jgi:hypothetical protein
MARRDNRRASHKHVGDIQVPLLSFFRRHRNRLFEAPDCCLASEPNYGFAAPVTTERDLT